jgi:hypothetical protein
MEGMMTQENRPSSNITDELSKLGTQVAEALRMAWESDERKRLQAEVQEGLQKFSAELDSTVKRAADSDKTKKIVNQTQEVFVKAQQSEVADNVRDGLLTGLQALNRELGRLLDRLETEKPMGAAPEAAAVPPAAPAAPSETDTEPGVGPEI